MSGPALSIKVGTKVRSFDFPDNVLSRDPKDSEHACFAEGVVVEITDPATHPMFHDCARYAVRVERRVFGGSGERDQGLVGETIYPPVNGTATWTGGVTNGVEAVCRCGDPAIEEVNGEPWCADTLCVWEGVDA